VNDNRGFPKVNDLNLEIRRGEILGLAGVDGNGQKELLEAITGLRKVESGRIVLNKLEITNFRPQNIFKNKISYIPQDRQNVGLILEFSIAENLILKSHAEAPFSKKGKLDFNKISLFAEELIERFDIRPYDKTQKVKTLSGGNQQKVIIAREIAHNPDLLIASQPTRGLDVGAIEFVHRELLNFRDNNKAILLVSLELDEIMAISDRIAVMFEGKIVAVLDAKDADPEIIGLLMAGGKRERLSS
jgi:simple sugar transport system ATP-binding protein